ncbi:outer membrane beta-barrel protein [Rapidithrix thailandica]|uniref:Outer membrane beta-barrel protein n=1 Tax=Rapidithrix thailandica TaxID=413964 RepID=A0AAW9SCI3_9BACT
MKFTFTLFCLLSNLMFSLSLFAQDSQEKNKKLTLSGYVDVYYSDFSDSLGANEFQLYSTVSPRSKRFGLNAAQITANYEEKNIRGTVTLHYGDIAQATWSSEFPVIQEANAGVRLGKGWWVDGGFFTTHIGTESFLPKNNFTSSTTIATYNEPFFQSGARLSYEGSEKIAFQFHVVSGYNFFLDKNNAKSVGVLFSYSPTSKFTLSYSNLLGRESEDGIKPKQFRVYQNLYFQYQPTEAFTWLTGADMGIQSHSGLDHPEEEAVMYNVLTTLNYKFSPVYGITLRGEIFSDPDGFISGTLSDKNGNERGFEAYGITFSNEYKPSESSFLRLEGRYIKAKDALEVFYQDGPQSHRFEWMVTLGLYLDKSFSF